MAVYKPTFCYPFLNNIDIRTVSDIYVPTDSTTWKFNSTMELFDYYSVEFQINFTCNNISFRAFAVDSQIEWVGFTPLEGAIIDAYQDGWVNENYRIINILTPENEWSVDFRNFLEANAQKLYIPTVSSSAQWLKCKIDTSNKNITGYRIKLLDENNNQIFPIENQDFISPISELEDILPDNPEINANTGINGTFLYVPFFQNLHNKILDSHNAIYFSAKYKVDYFLADMTGWQVVYVEGDQERLEKFPSWDGTISTNEKVSVGDLILVPAIMNAISEVAGGGIYVVGEDGKLIPVFKFEDLSTNDTILIMKGDYSNALFTIDPSETLIPWLKQTDDYSWVDAGGNVINISFDNQNYKWSIELYQGDGVEWGESMEPHWMTYNNLSTDWFDMTLTTGKILGSTSKRIQIAKNFADTGEPENWKIPTFSSNNPIVLQGTWMELLSSESENSTVKADRIYVSSYDMTLGHAYPRDGELSPDDIRNANYIRFYKYSNNQSYVLENDQVTCASTEDIPLYSDDAPADPEVNVVDGIGLSDGDRILVKDQNEPKENGIYVYYKNAPWKRAGSYSEWGNFLGKVVLVVSGAVNGGQNFQSQATVGGTLYYSKNSSQYREADSPLYWKKEAPILLYNPNEISDYQVTFTKFYENGTDAFTQHLTGSSNPESFIAPIKEGFNIRATSQNARTIQIDQDTGEITVEKEQQNIDVLVSYYLVTPSNNEIDGISVQEGDTCYVVNYSEEQTVADGKIVKAVLQGSTIVWETYKGSEEIQNKVIYTQKGEYTGICLKYYPTSWEESSQVYASAYDAQILKNSDGEVFISPYEFLQTGQKIKLINGYIGDNNPTQWITISNLNKTIWKVNYNSSLGTIPSEDPDNSNIPYKYEIRSFFKQSDENPFSIYEQGYLTIDSSYGPFNYDSVSERGIQFEGHYHQNQAASWESYRWILVNSAGETIQDTGEKYDGRMLVNFYGLSNSQLDNLNNYTAILYVTDEFGITLEKIINFEVYYASGQTSNLRLLGSLDCDSQSIVFNIMNHDSGETYSNNLVYSVYRRQWEQFGQNDTFSSITRNDNVIVVGEWEPVVINYSEKSFRDFNIKEGYSYEYVLYTTIDDVLITQYGITDLNREQSSVYGDIFEPIWQYWSLTELFPVKLTDNATPIIQKQFQADLNNVWIFKYNAEYGQQVQNFSKNEINTIGRYSKVGFGVKNYLSGDISCLLGSEIVPMSAEGYVERLRNGINRPLSTNEKVRMLNQWRQIAFSRNPKLLKDNKGQSWIVQIFSSSNTPYSKYVNQPDSISFSWKEINENTNGTLIWGSGESLPTVGQCNSLWTKLQRRGITGVVVSINVKTGVDNMQVQYTDPITLSNEIINIKSLGWTDILVKKGTQLQILITPEEKYTIIPDSIIISSVNTNIKIGDTSFPDYNYTCTEMSGVTIEAGNGIAQVYLSTSQNALWGYPSGYYFQGTGTITVYGYAVVESGWHLVERPGAQMVLNNGAETNIYMIGSVVQDSSNFGTVNAQQDTSTYLLTFGEKENINLWNINQDTSKFGVFRDGINYSNTKYIIGETQYSVDPSNLFWTKATLKNIEDQNEQITVGILSRTPNAMGWSNGFVYQVEDASAYKILEFNASENFISYLCKRLDGSWIIHSYTYTFNQATTLSFAVGNGNYITNASSNLNFSILGFELIQEYASQYNIISNYMIKNNGENVSTINCNNLIEHKSTTITLKADSSVTTYSFQYYYLSNTPYWLGNNFDTIWGGQQTSTVTAQTLSQDRVLPYAAVGKPYTVSETIPGQSSVWTTSGNVPEEGAEISCPYYYDYTINVPTVNNNLIADSTFIYWDNTQIYQPCSNASTSIEKIKRNTLYYWTGNLNYGLQYGIKSNESYSFSITGEADTNKKTLPSLSWHYAKLNSSINNVSITISPLSDDAYSLNMQFVYKDKDGNSTEGNLGKITVNFKDLLRQATASYSNGRYSCSISNISGIPMPRYRISLGSSTNESAVATLTA